MPPEDLPDLKAEIERLLPRKGEDPELRCALHRWLVRRLRKLASGVTIPDDDFEEMPMLEENLLEWRNKAVREGVRKGQIAGKRQFLLQQLEQRFGALPAKVRRKVTASSETRLEELVKRILVAGSLAEMGLE